VAFGPLFHTSTKPDHEPIVGLDRLREVKNLLAEIPVVTIGGVTEENFRSALASGADSVAVISDLLKEPGKIAQKLRRMLSAPS
jgi:thiamine-phosphate pyrophosphorylase